MATVHECTFGSHVTVHDFVELVNVTVGDHTYIAPESRFRNSVIGKYCSIGPEVLCGLGIHPTRGMISTCPAFFSVGGQAGVVFTDHNLVDEWKEVTIGNDVWIGARAMVMDGVVIGDGAIIGAGSVVTRDVPAYAVAAGVPARVLRYRFAQPEIDNLERLQWWNKSDDWLRARAGLFADSDRFFGSAEAMDSHRRDRADDSAQD